MANQANVPLTKRRIDARDAASERFASGSHAYDTRGHSVRAASNRQQPLGNLGRHVQANEGHEPSPDHRRAGPLASNRRAVLAGSEFGAPGVIGVRPRLGTRLPMGASTFSEPAFRWVRPRLGTRLPMGASVFSEPASDGCVDVWGLGFGWVRPGFRNPASDGCVPCFGTRLPMSASVFSESGFR